MKLYDELVARGLIAQVTNEEEIREMIDNGKATFYIGFDPTADSLHVGHFMALCLMKRLQMAGNRPIALIGGGTGMVGDPSGRSDMRTMMTPETIQHNCDCFKKQMERFIEFGEGKAMMVNNADWLMNLNYVELLREVGACFSVNNMLRAECYKQRMEKGLSFLEFNYMIMQSYDFYYLFQHYNCNMQFGGNDQWSNMLGGTELIRRKLGQDAHAMTITLLLNSEGKKMGKTAAGAVWLDPNKTSPYDFYQYWRNVEDADVLKCIRMLTFLPLEQIDEMDQWEGSQLNRAKEILAYELTALVHGKEEAEKAQAAAKALFAGGGDRSSMPTTTLCQDDFCEGKIGLLDLLVKCGLCPSKGEARRLVQQGGVSVCGKKVADMDINASAAKAITTENCTVSNISKTRKGISFDYLAESLPYPLDTLHRGLGSRPQSMVDRLVPFTEEMNQERLKVTGLKGEHDLYIDGQFLGSWSAEQFAEGINLAELTWTPQYQQALEVMYLNEMRWEIERSLRDYAWVQYGILQRKGLVDSDDKRAIDAIDEAMPYDIYVRPYRNGYAMMMHKNIREVRKAEMELIIDKIYQINKPVTRKISIVKK